MRFLIAFPIESLARNLVMWKSGDKNQKRYLPFERAVGTAMVYAYLDVKNVVSHVEMGSRIYDAAQLPWVMPTGVTFPLLVAEFKAMCSGNITGDGWMKRSMLWNILALQNPDGSWNVSDSLAAALRAAGEPELAAPIPKLSPQPIVKSFYAAEELVRHCPPALRACVDTLGHGVVDKIWVTLLAMEGCSQAGLVWVLNPWDDVFAEFDILQCGWTYVELRVKGDPQVAAAVLEAERAAKTCITEWREGFVAAATALRAARAAEEARAKKLAQAKEKGFIAKACLALWWALTSPVGFVTFWVKYLIGFVKWGLRLYFAAHIFLRAFLANPTDAFSGAERVVMQTTCYLAALIITVWFYYNKATQCCVMLREDIGCSSDVLEACDVVPAGAGCAAFMAQKQLKPAGWSCGAFPDKKNGWHFLTVIAIQIAIMFPVKFTLTRMFTAGGGGVLEPHWRQAVVAAGMNMMEVYAAYLECLFQAFEDPVGVFQKPEIAKIIAQFSAVFKKLLMVTLMTYFMSFVGGIFWLLDRLGIWRRRRKKEARFEDVAVIRARIGAFAGEGADAEDVKLRIEDDHAAAGAASAAAVAGGVSVERRRMFTKGTPSGAAAAMSDGAADAAAGLAAAGDVAAGFPASTVFGSPAAPKRELPHMRALCGEGDIVARGASVKRSASLDSETSSGSDADKGDSFADEGARGDHEARLRDAVSATRATPPPSSRGWCFGATAHTRSPPPRASRGSPTRSPAPWTTPRRTPRRRLTPRARLPSCAPPLCATAASPPPPPCSASPRASPSSRRTAPAERPRGKGGVSGRRDGARAHARARRGGARARRGAPRARLRGRARRRNGVPRGGRVRRRRRGAVPRVRLAARRGGPGDGAGGDLPRRRARGAPRVRGGVLRGAPRAVPARLREPRAGRQRGCAAARGPRRARPRGGAVLRARRAENETARGRARASCAFGGRRDGQRRTL